METYKKGELSKEILMGFLTGGLIVSCIVCPGLAPILKWVGATDARERARTKRTVNNLVKKGVLTARKKNGQTVFMVTRKGKQQLSNYLIEDLVIKEQKPWDRTWRVLMFDIPETRAKTRRAVSRTLKNMGMMAVQNSVFISPCPCKKEIDFVATHYSVQKYFIYLETNTIETKENIAARFRLNHS